MIRLVPLIPVCSSFRWLEKVKPRKKMNKNEQRFDQELLRKSCSQRTSIIQTKKAA